MAGLVGLAGCLLVPATTAQAAGAGACTDGAGVTVVVDFGPLGGADVRCAGASPGTGLDALSRAGFSYSFVPGKGPFVCSISGRPDPCNGAPTDAYWSYWSASRGGAWSYNNRGAHLATPAAGSVEGWSFGGGTHPSVAPPAPPAPSRPPPTQPPPTERATPPPPPPTPPTPSQPGPGQQDQAPAQTAPAQTAPDGSTPPAEGPDDRSDASTRPGRDDGADGPAATDGPGEDDDDRAASDGAEQLATEETSSSSGSSVGAIVAAVVAALLIGGAVWEVRRRRVPS